jgi:Tol biopolymer transport system component|uniref:Tol-Pal system protein TolB n=1 Tax=Candidatus Methanophagaceae archaeon ANME-1 ERB6 TaxID=2759912 RepID=A0A7G9YYH3_9EURY|nr:Tol-Pal system protein TolB [Methanosarcinales archaeon ANME-1 ERB6]
MLSRKTLVIGITLILVLGISALVGIYLKGETPVHRCTITSLADTSADERYPVWSPDGNKIFFKSDDCICVCNPDGSQRENLTEFKGSFVFSPDMKRVFYKKTIPNEGKVTYQAYVMDIDGKNQKKIAELALEEKYVNDEGYIGNTNALMYTMYSWSPDRTKIFFTKLEETGYTWVWREEEGKWVRYKAGTEPSVPVEEFLGAEQRLIAKEHEETAWIWDLQDNELRFIGHLSNGIVHYVFEPEVVWSPDGKYVALPSVELSEAGATEQIFVINVETGESKRLTSFIGSNTWPEWSPDSKKIMYVRVPPKYWYMPFIFNNDEGGDIWVGDIDGSSEKQLTDIPMNWEDGFWSSNGSKIAYISWENHERIFEIWMMNADGSDKKLLVRIITEWIAVLEWSPDGSKIAFDIWKIVEGKLDHDIYVMDVHAKEEVIK